METIIDLDLLHDYARANSQVAFATLVERHVNLVYAAAHRQVRSPQLAEEVTQSVFPDLARPAGRFPPAQPLTAWLFTVTRRTAIDVVRRESRRLARENAAAEIAAMKTPPPTGTPMRDVLDEAVETLPEPDRTAILLRFFENKSLREVGAALGTSDAAAQKRVTRALDQLRTFFLRRGVTITAADLSAHALQVAPAALATAIATSALSLGTATLHVATVHAAQTLAMTTLQKSFAVTVLVALGGAGLSQARLVAQQSDELAALQSQQLLASAALGDLRTARDAATAKLKTVEQQIDARLTAALSSSVADPALESQMQQWLTQVDRLKDFLAQRPEWNIPELKLLSEQSWFTAAATDLFESEEQFRRATARLRDRAVGLAAQKIRPALIAYVRAHDGQLPNNALELAPFSDPPLDPAILGRYEMMQTGKASDVPRNESIRTLAPRPADVEYDAYSYIGTTGQGNSGVAMSENVRGAQRRFSAANSGERPDQRIPEMQFLAEEDWLRVAKDIQFDSDEATRRALAALRTAAAARFQPQLTSALRGFAKTPPENPPTILALQPFADPPIDPSLLARYELSKTTEIPPRWKVQTKDPVDADYDTRHTVDVYVDNRGYGGGSATAPTAWIPDFREQSMRAYQAYTKANNGTSAPNLAAALPYFDPPLAPAVLEKLLKAERARPR